MLDGQVESWIGSIIKHCLDAMVFKVEEPEEQISLL